jgi:hypothetical protein
MRGKQSHKVLDKDKKVDWLGDITYQLEMIQGRQLIE